MKIDWIILAEGIAQDADGAITAVGLNRNVFIARELPAVTKRATIAHVLLEPGELEVGQEVGFRFSITSPSGEVLSVNSGTVLTEEGPPWPELPNSFDIPAETRIQVREYGEHVLEFTFRRPDGAEVSGDVALYVVESPSEAK